MCQTPGVSAMLFGALAQANVNVVAIAQGASEYNITVVVKNKQITKALNAVHSKLYLSKTVISVGIVGPGLVGKTLLRQMNEQLAELKSDYAVDLRVVAITGANKMLLSSEHETVLDLTTWESLYAGGELSQSADMEKFTTHILDAGSPNSVIIDCSASEAVAMQYKGWLQKGINVVTPNKKANSGDLKYVFPPISQIHPSLFYRSW